MNPEPPTQTQIDNFTAEMNQLRQPLREEIEQAWLRSYGWGQNLSSQAERLGEIASAVGRLQEGLARAVLENSPEDQKLQDFLTQLGEELEELAPQLQASGRPQWLIQLIENGGEYLQEAGRAREEGQILKNLDRAGNRLFWFGLLNRGLRQVPFLDGGEDPV